MSLLVVAALALIGLGWKATRTGWREAWSAEGTVAAGFVLASIGFFWQFWLLPGVSVPRGGGDLVSFLYPTYRFAAEELQAGRFPFWNPHLFGGAPFAADLQSGLFYPPNLVAFFLARPFTYEALETLAALHYPVAAMCAYALARELGLTRLPAFAAGLAFAFSGFMVAHLGHYNMLAAAAWTPLALALLDRATRRSSTRWAVLAGGAYAMVLLAGHTQVALYAALAMALLWLVRLRERGVAWPVVAALPVALAVGAAASAILLLPAFELTRLSVRADITYAQAAEYAASPLGLITFVVPSFFGDGPDNYWGLRWSLHESYGYVGVAGLVLATLALTAPRRREVPGALALFAALALLVALGETTPLHGYLYRLVPGFDKVRAPGRALLFVDLCFALLIGLGVARLRARPGWRDRPGLRLLLRGLAVVLAAGALVAAPLAYFAALTSQDKDPTILRRALQAAGSVSLSLLLLAAALALLWRWRRRAAPWIGPAVVGLLWLDLAASSGGFNPTTADLLAGYHHPAIVGWLREHAAGSRIDTRTGIADVWQPDTALLEGFDDVSGLFNPLTLASVDRYWEDLGSRAAPGYDLLSARYLIARPDAPLDPKFRKVVEEGGLAVFENTQALPRAFVAPRAEWIGPAETAARLRDPAFHPADVVLLQGAAAGGEGAGRVEGVDRPSPQELVVRLSGVTGGYLALSESYYPGWSAVRSDGPAPVLRAYSALMAVPLTPGTAEVRLSFRPTMWVPALALTAMGWLSVLAAAVYGVAVSARSSRARAPVPGPAWS